MFILILLLNVLAIVYRVKINVGSNLGSMIEEVACKINFVNPAYERQLRIRMILTTASSG